MSDIESKLKENVRTYELFNSNGDETQLKRFKEIMKQTMVQIIILIYLIISPNPDQINAVFQKNSQISFILVFQNKLIK